MFADGKRILIHRKRSPFPPLGKVNGIRNFNKNRLKYGKSIVFIRIPSDYIDINKTTETSPYLPFFEYHLILEQP